MRHWIKNIQLGHYRGKIGEPFLTNCQTVPFRSVEISSPVSANRTGKSKN